MNTPTLNLNLAEIWFHSTWSIIFSPCLRFQLFNECLHTACYCLKLCSKRQIAFHSSTHYRANALCPHSLSPHFLRQSMSVQFVEHFKWYVPASCHCSIFPSQRGCLLLSSDAHSTFSHVSSLATLFIFIFIHLCICSQSFVASFLQPKLSVNSH